MAPVQDVKNALVRIRGVMNPKKEAERVTRDIRLGLERVVQVVPRMQNWKGVHVGGTNGKGSICAYLSGLFTLAGVGYGRFVSPAFPEKHHAVTVNGRYVSRRAYDDEMRHVEASYHKVTRNWRLTTGEAASPLSPYELETVTAFQLFNKAKVPYGIVEVGMGGATDATNAMHRKAVTVISKIDLEHQEYLGRTIKEIAKVKAGIMRPGVPCIVDHTNSSAVIDVLRRHADEIGTTIQLSHKGEPLLKSLTQNRWNLEDYQRQNLLCAALAFRNLFPSREINIDKLLELEPQLPGRMEWVGISDLTTGQDGGAYKSPVLVDAAHNLAGVQALSRYTETHMRNDGDKPVTWVMGLSSSQTKPFDQMIETLVRPQDNVAFVEYEQQSNEPPATPATMGRDILQHILHRPEDQIYTGDATDIRGAIAWAGSKAMSTGNLCVTGSLYLIRDFYKLDGVSRSRGTEERSPGPSHLWRLSKLWRQRPLSREEYREFEAAKSQWSRMNGATEEIEHESTASDAATSLDSVVDMATKTDAQPPKPSFEAVKALYGRTKYHERQLRGYEAALRSISNDIGPQPGDGHDEALASSLRQSVDALRQQADRHQKALDQATDQLRNHPDAPLQYALTYSEIYGRALDRRSTPFMEPTELDELAKREAEAALKAQKEAEAAEAAKLEPEEDDTTDIKTDFWGRPEGIDQIPESHHNKKLW